MEVLQSFSDISGGSEKTNSTLILSEIKQALPECTTVAGRRLTACWAKTELPLTEKRNGVDTFDLELGSLRRIMAGQADRGVPLSTVSLFPQGVYSSSFSGVAIYSNAYQGCQHGFVGKQGTLDPSRCRARPFTPVQTANTGNRKGYFNAPSRTPRPFWVLFFRESPRSLHGIN